MSDEPRPIIVRRVYKRPGHHGGSWKVAFADFATALMAFFLLMWLVGSATKAQKEGIADYFDNPAGVQGPGGASVSAIKLGGGMDGVAAPKLVGEEGPPQLVASAAETSNEAKDAADAADSDAEASKSEDQARLRELLETLEEAVAGSQALEPYKDHLLLDITPQGLRIQIVDHENKSMFDVGSSNLRDYSDGMLRQIGAIINAVPNKVSIAGHTDSRPYVRPDYSNWELSADRANAARRALVRGGMPADKVAQVVGLGSSVLFDKDDPLNPVNRRISIVVLTHEAEMHLGEEAPVMPLRVSEAQ